MPHTLREAAAAVGVDRTTLLRAIKAGRLSATRDRVSGAWLIEPAELHRLYPPVERTEQRTLDPEVRTPDPQDAELRELRVRLAAAEDGNRVRDDVIADLRAQRDREAEERRQAQTQLMALLTDQRARVRRTWRWWRRS